MNLILPKKINTLLVPERMVSMLYHHTPGKSLSYVGDFNTLMSPHKKCKEIKKRPTPVSVGPSKGGGNVV